MRALKLSLFAFFVGFLVVAGCLSMVRFLIAAFLHAGI